ncbi:Negative regulator of sexual conjugation and meiosis [Mycena kentingensis (nom. inval.)]|nr:Negative regulator of sexual conjugation and meiosis [Mycena kentingensis (nom. inval.)]
MSPSDNLPDLTGSLVDGGRLKLTRLLGAGIPSRQRPSRPTLTPIGAYGKVYHALDNATTPPSVFAVKVLGRPSSRLVREAKFQVRERILQARVSAHRNVVTLHRVFQTREHIFMVYDYCGQGDLYKAIVDGAFTGRTRLIKRIFIQVVDAVAWCHTKSVFHRDVKPENILVDLCTGKVKLTDFGLATTSQVSRDMECGSPSYLPPGTLLELRNSTRSMSPWRRATIDDARFRDFLLTDFSFTTRHPRLRQFHPGDYAPIHDPDFKRCFLRQILPLSIPLARLLTRSFSPSANDRPTLREIREEVLNIALYMTTRELSSASSAMKRAAGFTASQSPSTVPLSDEDDDSDEDQSAEHHQQTPLSPSLAKLVNPDTAPPSVLIRSDVLAVSISPLPITPQNPAPAPATCSVPNVVSAASPNPGSAQRILQRVRKASIASVNSIRKPRRMSDASSVCPPLGHPILFPVEVALPPTRDDEMEDEIVEREEVKKRRRRSSVSAGLRRFAGKVWGRKSAEEGEQEMNVQEVQPSRPPEMVVARAA